MGSLRVRGDEDARSIEGNEMTTDVTDGAEENQNGLDRVDLVPISRMRRVVHVRPEEDDAHRQ